MGINIGDGFFQILGEQGHIFWVLWVDLTLAILLILCVQQRVVPRNYYSLFIF